MKLHGRNELVVDNLVIRWVEENARFRGNNESSVLDLIITRKPDIIDKMNYKTL